MRLPEIGKEANMDRMNGAVRESKSAVSASAQRPGKLSQLFGRLFNRTPPVEQLLDAHLPKVLAQVVASYRRVTDDPKVARDKLKAAYKQLGAIKYRLAVLQELPVGDTRWLLHARAFIKNLEAALPKIGKGELDVDAWIGNLRAENPDRMFGPPPGIPRPLEEWEAGYLIATDWALEPCAEGESRNALQVVLDTIHPEASKKFFEAVEAFGGLTGQEKEKPAEAGPL